MFGKNVLMIHPPFSKLGFGDEWKKMDSLAAPLGLMYIGNVLINDGYNVKFIDFNIDKLSKNQFLNILSKSDFILLSCYTESIKNVYEIIKMTREINKNAFIICGGPYCKLTRNYVPDSDITFIGDAENIIGELFKKIVNNESLSEIPGLIYKKNNRVIKNSGYLQAINIDDSKSAASILTKNKNYGVLFGFKIKNLVGTITSRGCPFNCSFCTLQGSLEQKLRKRSVESVIMELKDLYESGAKYVIFYDDNFLIDKKRVVQIMDRIIEEKIKLKILVQGRVDSVDINFYEKLYKAGVILIMFGIENANQDVLDFYNKGTKIEQIKKAIELANKVGIFTWGWMIIGSPIETKKHFEVNKKFIKKAPLDIVFINVLAYAEGSPLWKKAVEEGKLNKNESMVYANEKLSRYPYKTWVKMVDELLKGFYSKPSRILRIFYKSYKAGILPTVFQLFWVGRKSIFIKMEQNPLFSDNRDSVIEI